MSMDLVDMTDRQTVHRRLSEMAEARAWMDYELGRWLLAGERVGAHVVLGYASYGEYVERLFGFDRRQVRERLRVAKRLEELPLMAAALPAGELCWSIVRELSRIVTPETEAEWIGRVARCTAHQVERLVAQHRPGARPTDKPTAEKPKRVTFEVSAATWALLEEAKKTLRAEHGGSVSDDVVVTALARALLEGGAARDAGQASYQIGLIVCERCSTATQRAGGDEVVVDAATVERAECDAQLIGRVDVATPGRASQTIPPKVRRAVSRRHGDRCAVPGCRHAAFVDIHHVERRADGGDHDPERLIMLCGAHHAAVHEGTLVIRGTYSTGFEFEHADGSAYGEVSASPARSALLAQVLVALVGMGWKQREAQGMVDRVRAHVGHETSASEAMRLALREGALPNASCVREELATYAATHVGRGERCAAFEQGALPNVGWVREELATYEATGVGRGERCAGFEQAVTHVGRETSAGEAARAA